MTHPKPIDPIDLGILGCELVFELKSGCFFSAMIVNTNVSFNDLNIKVDVSIQVMKTMTPDEILRMWLKGEINQFQEDYQKNDSVEVIARAIVRVSKSMPANAMYYVTLIQSAPSFSSMPTMGGETLKIPMQESVSQKIGKVFI